MAKRKRSYTEKPSRREFLKASSLVGAGMTVPYFFSTKSVWADNSGNKPTIAAIGVGGSRGRYNRGGSIANQAANLGRMIAVCDVDDKHNAEFNEKHGGNLSMYTDYRKLFEKEKPDVVTIGTPDHWHIPIALEALYSGCDVYCEKPLTLTLEEGAIIREAVKETGKVFQVGTQQRTEMNRLFMYAVAIVRSGRLGEKVNAHCAIGGGLNQGPFENTEVPEGLDWDMWVGPAPKVDYCEERRKIFRWYLEYSGGKMTDWGAHHIDIAQWALGLDSTGPTSIHGTGEMTDVVPEGFDWAAFLNGETTLPNGYNSATKFNINLDFAAGNRITVNNEYVDGDTKFGNGILFTGEKGRMFVNRGKLQGKIVEELFGSNLGEVTDEEGNKRKNYGEAVARLDAATKSEFDEVFLELHKGKKSASHMANFFDCVEDRGEPISDVASHVRTMASCHLCNIALMLGRELKWDPVAENFGSDDEANALMTRKRRAGYALPTAAAATS